MLRNRIHIKNRPMDVAAANGESWKEISQSPVRQTLFHLETELEYKLELLHETLRSVQETCAEHAQRIEQQGMDYAPNSLGLLQGEGAAVERLCAEIGVIRKVIEDYKKAHNL